MKPEIVPFCREDRSLTDKYRVTEEARENCRKRENFFGQVSVSTWRDNVIEMSRGWDSVRNIPA